MTGYEDPATTRLPVPAVTAAASTSTHQRWEFDSGLSIDSKLRKERFYKQIGTGIREKYVLGHENKKLILDLPFLFKHSVVNPLSYKGTCGSESESWSDFAVRKS
jgi:hypothetical protein